MVRKIKYTKVVLAILCILIAISCIFIACHVSSGKKDQYAVLHDYQKNKVITINSDDKNYEKLVEQITMDSVSADKKDIPGNAAKIKKLIFYQSNTKTLIDFGKKSKMKPVIEIDIYRENDNQYMDGHLNSDKNLDITCKMSKELSALVDTLGL